MIESGSPVNNRIYPRNMVECLRGWAQSRPGDTALVVVGKNGDLRLDYAALDGRVRLLAAALQQRLSVGERALLLLDNDEHYVTAFFACLYAGVIAVPVFPPESLREQALARLVGIAADSEAACILTSSTIQTEAGAGLHDLKVPLLLAVDQPQSWQAGDWREHRPLDGDIAFLQYTSGSTAAPKGVMVSHANLVANERAIEASMGITEHDVFVSWLPLYHDMGLIGGLLQPVHRGIPAILMSPSFFIERPIRWLDTISRYRATLSGAPDFAFRLCTDRIKPAQLKELDLSCLRVLFSGAEPVRHATLMQFGERFAEAGLDGVAIYPCYGLAEATLLVSGGQRGGGLIATAFSTGAMAQGRAVVDPQADSAMQVACGFPAPGHGVAIVEPERLAMLDDGQVGEIWAYGPSIAAGYWRNQAASEATFVQHQGQRYLRTGDLGAGAWRGCRPLALIRGTIQGRDQAAWGV